MKQIKLSKASLLSWKTVIALALVVVVVAALTIYPFRILNMLSTSKSTSDMQAIATPAMKQTFVKLAAAHTDVCRDLGDKAAIESYMNSLPNNARLQGSCCNPMVLNKFVSQIKGLKQYSGIPQIPKDPYDVSAASAKQMLGYYDSIYLTNAQQSTYNSAKSKTDDQGWCCCQCWAWYTHAGLAKYLISEHNFTTQQVIAVTNLEDCCGGV